jgi:hypothetical protein
VAITNLNKYLRPRLQQEGARLVVLLKNSLERQKHVDTGKLLDSIRSEVVIYSGIDFLIRFRWKAIGDYLNEPIDPMYPSDAGMKRITRWARKKWGLDAKKGKRAAWGIVKKWHKIGRFPRSKTGWAAIALRDRQSAIIKQRTAEALQRSVEQAANDRIREINRRK